MNTTIAITWLAVASLLGPTVAMGTDSDTDGVKSVHSTLTVKLDD